MKNFKLCSMAAAMVMVLLTSCLGDSGSSSRSERSQFAVASTDSKTFRTLLNVFYYGPIYSPSIETVVSPGNCYLVDYEIDFGSAENVNVATNGYYQATIGNIQEVDKGAAIPQQTDTTVLIENEQPVKKMAVYSFVDNHFCLTMNFVQSKNQQTDWEVYYDPSQEPKKNSDGQNYYDLFVRAIKKVEGQGSASESTVVQAVGLKNFLDHCLEKEKAANQKVVNFKFNYLASMNEKDSTDLKWEAVSVPFTVSTTN